MSPKNTIVCVGERLDIVLRQGATFSATHTLYNPDGSAMDLTGATVRAQVKRTAADTTPAATFTVTMAGAGAYTFALPAADTAALSAEPGPDGTEYLWDSELEDSQGNVIPLYFGVLRLVAAVTTG